MAQTVPYTQGFDRQTRKRNLAKPANAVVDDFALGRLRGEFAVISKNEILLIRGKQSSVEPRDEVNNAAQGLRRGTPTIGCALLVFQLRFSWTHPGSSKYKVCSRFHHTHFWADVYPLTC